MQSLPPLFLLSSPYLHHLLLHLLFSCLVTHLLELLLLELLLELPSIVVVVFSMFIFEFVFGLLLQLHQLDSPVVVGQSVVLL